MILTESQKEEIISFTCELIRFSETSGNERKTAESIHRKMHELGYDEVHVDKFGSVLGILNGSSPGPTLLLDAHMDVVPIRDQDKWEHAPFGAEISDGRIWGRGSADMKGALAAMACTPAYLDRSEFKGKILVSASVAEEFLIGSALSHILMENSVDAVVIGEPTGLKLGFAEKGRASIEMICHGTVAHSSRPESGDNAIYRMMEAVRRIRSLPRRTHALLGEEVIELVEISSLPTPGNGSIPGACKALWECRLLPGESKENFLGRWKTALEGVGRTELNIADYELRTYTGNKLKMTDFLPGWLSDKFDKRFTDIVAQSIMERGRKVEYYAAPYGCNALVSAALWKIPTVILGPGDIDSAHKPNENIVIEELVAAAAVYGKICRNYSMS